MVRWRFARFITFAMLGVSIGIVSATASAPLRGQSTVADIVRVSYVQTTSSSVDGGGEAVVEQGTISIDPNGRYRIDRQRSGVASAEIVDVTTNQRVILDLDKHTALTGTLLMAPVTPGPGQRPVEQPVLRNADELERATVSLGTRVVDGLVLEGTKETITSRRTSGSLVVDTAEMWLYRFARPGVVLVERRFAGENWADERRIVDVTRTQVSDELFKVPAGFAVVDSLR